MGISVENLLDHLDIRATDREIEHYAAENDFVVFSRDEDFIDITRDCGVLFMHQLNNPDPKKVAEAVRQICISYRDFTVIREPVPGIWV